MATTTISDIIDLLGKLQQNYTALAQYWYDIFYNPEPKQIDVDYYNKEGEKIIVTISNLAQIREDLGGVYGEGAPASDLVADKFGTIYHDTKDGELYKYTRDPASSLGNGYWVKLLAADILDSVVIAGSDPIENHVESKDGVMYLAKDTHRVYLGRNNTWERIDASPSLANQQTFKVTSGATSVVTTGLLLDSACADKNFVFVFVDGALLSPSKYYISNNGFRLKFTKPLVSPESTKIEVVVKYFTSLSLYEDYWTEEETTLDDGTVVTHKKYQFTKDLFESIQSITEKITELDNALDELCRLEENPETGEFIEVGRVPELEARVEEVSQDLDEAVAAAVGNVTEKVKVIESSVINEKNTVVSLHNSVKNWYEQVSGMRNEVSNVKMDIHDDVQWLVDTFTDEDGNIDLKKFVYIDDFTREMSQLRTTVNNKVDTTVNALNVSISNMDSAVKANEISINSLSNDVNSLSSTIGSIPTMISNTEASIRKDCFSETNFPIGFYAPCKIGTTLDNFIHQYLENGNTKYRIDMELMRDCSYYIMDFTEDLQNNGSNKFYKQFNIINNTFDERDLSSVDSNGQSSVEPSTSPYEVTTTGMLENLDISDIVLGDILTDGDFILTVISYSSNPDMIVRQDTQHYAVGTEFNIPEYNNFSFRITNEIPHETGSSGTEDTYLLQVRVLLKNNSEYKPRILWDNSNITWLGSEEPDFDAKKSYLLEFISYDMGATWFAHTLGICQPSINGDLVERTFTINLTHYNANTDLGVLCDVYYTKDDNKTYYAGEYTIDNGGVIRNVVLKFTKKELGDSFSNIRIHKATDNLFVKHTEGNITHVVDDTLPDEIITIDLTAETVTDNHYYGFKLFNEDIPSQSYKVTFNFKNSNNDNTQVVTKNNVYANSGILNIMLSSADEPDIFDGCNEATLTTPWKITSVDMVHEYSYTDPDTSEIVVVEEDRYSYSFTRALGLDATLNLYMEP